MSLTRITVFAVCAALASGHWNDSPHKTTEADLKELETLLSTLLAELKQEEAKTTASKFCSDNYGADTRNRLIETLTQGDGNVYIIFEDGYTCTSTLREESNLYAELKHVSPKHPSSKLWLNKVPCKNCINNLIAGFQTKPELHILSLYYDEVSFEDEELKSAVGCAYRVQEEGYEMTTEWDWDTKPLNLAGNRQPNKEYEEISEAIGDIFLMIKNLRTNAADIDAWCTS